MAKGKFTCTLRCLCKIQRNTDALDDGVKCPNGHGPQDVMIASENSATSRVPRQYRRK